MQGNSRDVESYMKRMADKAEQKEVFEAQKEEARKKYKLHLQEVFNTPDGVEFGKELVRLLGIFTSETCTNPSKMVEKNGAKAVYLELIRPFLTPEQRTKLER